MYIYSQRLQTATPVRFPPPDFLSRYRLFPIVHSSFPIPYFAFPSIIPDV